MTKPTRIDRRDFVLRNAAIAVAAAVPTGALASVADAPPRGPLNWRTASTAELEPLIGQRFRVSSADSGTIALRLIGVEPVHSGTARPEGLARTEGVIAVFDSPDKAALVAAGHGMHRVSHPQIGSADLFIGPVRERNGDDLLEIVLN